ncbi:FG-GAP repeat domain-containing protein [Actinoplanes sp. CA-252034]|uniref:FG-GAP repeat domain-containing protein n=1 Tax=Actinoplanes sp. CA-252034 TaxID=3239906 RepID=UPI003D97DE77
MVPQHPAAGRRGAVLGRCRAGALRLRQQPDPGCGSCRASGAGSRRSPGRIAWDSGAGNGDAARSKPVSGDFNGDGRAEIGAFYNYDGATTRLFVFDDVATAATPRQTWDSGAGNWGGTRAKYVAGDFDGDGRTEIGTFYNYDNSLIRLFVFDGIGGAAGARQVWDSTRGGWDWNRTITVT